MIQNTLRTSAKASKNAYNWITLNRSIIQAERTPFDTIYQEDIAQLRYYPPLESNTKSIQVGSHTVPVEHKRYTVPIVIVAPLAVNMYIYDLFQDRSLVKYLNAKGFSVYMLDWGKPTSKHNHYHLNTYFGDIMPRMLAQVRQHSGSQQISLHGWSFGGLFSYCYTALHQDKDIKNLILVGAPCDYHANGDLGKMYQSISKRYNWVEKRLGWNAHHTKRRYWHAPGWQNALGFKLTNPVNSLQGYWDLLSNLNDNEYVSNHATNAAFLDRMESYPGGVMQDTFHYLVSKNALAKGKLPMEGKPELLPTITADILSVIGKQDPIVTPKNSRRLLAQVGSKDITELAVNGGHMGILGGSNAPQNSWFQITDWLAERSGELT